MERKFLVWAQVGRNEQQQEEKGGKKASHKNVENEFRWHDMQIGRGSRLEYHECLIESGSNVLCKFEV